MVRSHAQTNAHKKVNLLWNTETFTILLTGDKEANQTDTAQFTPQYQKLMISKLQGKDLMRFAKLNQKSKDKRLSIKMTTQEWETLKQLSELNGTPMSQQMRRAFFTQNVHLFKGVSHKKK